MENGEERFGGGGGGGASADKGAEIVDIRTRQAARERFFDELEAQGVMVRKASARVRKLEAERKCEVIDEEERRGWLDTFMREDFGGVVTRIMTAVDDVMVVRPAYAKALFSAFDTRVPQELGKFMRRSEPGEDEFKNS